MYQEKQDMTEEIDNLKQDLLLSDYPLHFISSTLSPSMVVCHGIQSSKKSGKANCFSTLTLCRGCLRSWNASGADSDPGQYLQQNIPPGIMRTKPQGDTQHMVHCVCSIQLECGRNYVGKSGRPPVVWLGEHSIWDRDIWKNPNWSSMPMKATSQ